METHTLIETIKDKISIKLLLESSFNSNVEIYSTKEKTEFLIDIKANVIRDEENIFFVELFNWLDKNNGQNCCINIIFPENFKDFTPDFISTLRLFNQNLRCKFTMFIYNKKGGNLSQKFQKSLFQEGLDFLDIIVVDKEEKRQKVVSEDKLPVIDIDINNFKYYFGQSIKSLLVENPLLEIKNATYKEFENHYQKKQDHDLDEIIIVHYYKLLDNIYCLYDAQKYKSENFKETEYYKFIYTDFIKQLQERPVFFILLLLPLLKKKFVKDKFVEAYQKKYPKLKQKDITEDILIADENKDIFNKYITFLKGQFEQAYEIYDGVFELAKNIVEHSETQTGHIAVKTITKKTLISNNQTNDKLWDDYCSCHKKIEFLDKQNKTYLNISIKDAGTKGIIETSVENMFKPEWRVIPKRLAQHDLKEIETGLKNCKNDNDEAQLLFDMYFGDKSLLNRQAENSYKGLGIFLFTKFIAESDGIFNVETNKYQERDITISFSFYSKLKNIRPAFINPKNYGTSYDIILPLQKKESPVENEMDDENKEIVPTKGIYEKMLSLEKKVVEPTDDKYYLEELDCYKLSKYVITDILSDQDKVLVFSLKSMPKVDSLFPIDKSMVFRDISKLFAKNGSTKSIIIKDAPEDLIVGLFNIFVKLGLFTENNNEKMILLLTEGNRKKGAVIAGTERKDCLKINRYISENGYFKVIDRMRSGKLRKDDYKNCNNILKDQILFADDQLILIDFFEKGSAYFEKPIEKKLKKSINNGGYNWENTHLKIGSKLHLNDFVYGKKVFQHSKEASEFAFLISRKIFENVKNEVENSTKKTVFTLIGYGYYSELLVSRTCGFVEKLLKSAGLNNQASIEYIIVKDEDDIKFSRYIHNVKERKEDELERLIIVVPISSTLTTCLKIENTLSEEKIYNDEQFKFEKTFYTIVVVGDEHELKDIPSNLQEYNEDTRFDAIKKHWENVYVDEKIIETKNRKKNDVRKNQFNIYIKSKWQLPSDCEHCFPESPIYERPLFVTDKVSVTPSLIFEPPKWYTSKQITTCKPYFEFKEGTYEGDLPVIDKIDWVHYKGDSKKHFNYYLHYIDFIHKNNEKNEKLKKWAESLKDKFKDKERVLLIAPDKAENGEFTHLINREVFNDKADIIRFDRHSDHYLNFEKFFGNNISNAQSIYFVDNLMLSGSTFLSLNDVLKISKHQKKIEGVFCLINRMDYGCYHTVTGHLRENNKTGNQNEDYLYSFVHLSVPESTIIPCPLCDEEKKYKELLENASLDCIKQYFVEKELPNFKEVEKEKLTEGNLPYDPSKKKHDSTILQAAFIHFLYNAFYDNEKNTNADTAFIECLKEKDLPNWEDGSKSFRRYLRFKYFVASFRTYISKNHQCNIDNISIINDLRFKSNLIKVLSGQSFKKHTGVYISVFYWVLCDLIVATRCILGSDYQFKGKYNILTKRENLDELTDFEILRTPLKDITKEEADDYIDAINYLRVLVKYASSLNISYLLHEDFLTAISKLSVTFSKTLLKEFEDKIKPKTERFNLMRYSFENFKLFCAAHIIRSLHNNTQRAIRFESNLRSIYDKVDDKSFLELLILENTGIIRQTLNNIEKDENDERLSDFNLFTNNINNNTIADILNLQKIISQKSKLKDNEEEFENRMVEKIAKIVNYDIEGGGGLLLYKYQDTDEKDKNYTFIGNTKNAQDLANNFNDFQNIFAINFLEGVGYLKSEGESKYTWTNFTLKKINNKWIGQDGFPEDEDKYSLFYDIKKIEATGANRILFIRISSYHKNEKELTGEAVFVFYDNGLDNKDVLSIHSVRFIHTLRNKISTYLRDKYENDTFKELEKQKAINNYMIGLHHGIENYENIMEYCIDGINKNLDNDKFEIAKNNAKFSRKILTNKFNLLSIMSLIESKKGSNVFQELTLRDMVKEFEKSYLFVLTYEDDQLSEIANENFVSVDFKKDIPEEELDRIKYTFPKSLLEEIVIEFLYNIRRHCVDLSYNHINEHNKLILLGKLELIDNIPYYSLTNNFKRHKRSQYKGKKHGLDFINNIFQKLYQKQILCDNKDKNHFTIKIPLILI